MKIKYIFIFFIFLFINGCTSNNVENYYGEYEFKKNYITNDKYQKIKPNKKQKSLLLNIKNNMEYAGTLLVLNHNKVIGKESFLIKNNEFRPITFNNVNYKIKNNYLFIHGEHWRKNLETKYKIKNRNTLLFINKNENNIYYITEIYKK